MNWFGLKCIKFTTKLPRYHIENTKELIGIAGGDVTKHFFLAK